MNLDPLAVTALATVLLAIGTVWLGWQTRGATRVAREELEELRLQRRAADQQRSEDARRERAMQLLKRVVDARSALDDLLVDLEADAVRPSSPPGSMPLPDMAWPRFAERWTTVAPELTTYLYVAEFVPENLRRTARDRMAAVERAGRRAEARSTPVLDAIKGLSATLDQVRESVDAALGLAPTQRPL